MASECAQFVWEDPDLGGYIGCVVPSIFNAVQLIAAGVAFVITIYLIYYTVTNLDNPQVLKDIGSKWIYLFIFVLVVVAGTGIIFIPLRAFGFEGFDYWLGVLEEFANALGVEGGAETP